MGEISGALRVPARWARADAPQANCSSSAAQDPSDRGRMSANEQSKIRNTRSTLAKDNPNTSTPQSSEPFFPVKAGRRCRDGRGIRHQQPATAVDWAAAKELDLGYHNKDTEIWESIEYGLRMNLTSWTAARRRLNMDPCPSSLSWNSLLLSDSASCCWSCKSCVP